MFRSDFLGARLQRHIISPAELDAKIAGAPACIAFGLGEGALLPDCGLLLRGGSKQCYVTRPCS